ncbi:outer membrane beta-barrel protein [Flaviaesturariibacter amylovorans]|uniref:Outer membrane beta-barrel family protein n=1 Tax=Flaviaesturariibacter amylovorans TaxID=1084520 RepID=A0ABP8GS02_9BACT
MERIALLFALLLASFFGLAQDRTGALRGSVTDAGGKAVESATVSLLRATDSAVLKLAAADKSGRYAFEGLSAGRYLVAVSAAGHSKTWSAPLDVNSATSDVPALVLQPASKSLTGVTVVARRPLIEQKADRMVVNVDAFASNAGTSALEVLEKSPGVTVDKDGGISLKGKQGVLVLMDGRPAYLTGTELANYLKSLPATAIDQVEIMTNPSARYDAAGNSGIINIKTKKNKVKGFNGSVTVGGSRGKASRSNNSLNMNYRTGKVNLFLNGSHSYFERHQNLDINRRFRDNGQTTAIFAQETRQRGHNNYLGLKLGADYFLSKRSTLGIVLSGGTNPQKGRSVSTSFLQDAQGVTDSIVTAESVTRETWKNKAVNLNFRHQFDSTGRELSADVDVVSYRTGNDQRFTNGAYDPSWVKRSADLLRGDLPVDINIYSAKIDYVQPLKGGAKLEGGLKGSYVRTVNSALYYNVFDNTEYVDTGKTNRFRYEEKIGAAYLNLNKTIGKWGLQAGLRYELTSYRGHQYGSPDKVLHPDSSFSRDYGSLFPTAFVSFAASKSHQLSFSYGRRIDRPDYQDLNPFLFFIDRYTLEQGNPYMRPQFTHNFELGHTFKGFLTTTLNYSSTRDMMSETFEQASVANGGNGYATIVRDGNIGRRESAGISVNAQVPVRKWWTAMLYTNFNYNKFSGRLNQDGALINMEATNLTTNINNQFNFGKGWTAELSGWYRTRGVEGQLVIMPMGAMQAGFGKTVLKGKGTLKANMRDIFFTNKVKGEIDFDGTEARFFQTRDTRQASVSFTWRFGKPIKDGRERRRSGGASEEQNRVKGAQ